MQNFIKLLAVILLINFTLSLAVADSHNTNSNYPVMGKSTGPVEINFPDDAWEHHPDEGIDLIVAWATRHPRNNINSRFLDDSDTNALSVYIKNNTDESKFIFGGGASTGLKVIYLENGKEKNVDPFFNNPQNIKLVTDFNIKTEIKPKSVYLIKLMYLSNLPTLFKSHLACIFFTVGDENNKQGIRSTPSKLAPIPETDLEKGIAPKNKSIQGEPTPIRVKMP